MDEEIMLKKHLQKKEANLFHQTSQSLQYLYLEA